MKTILLVVLVIVLMAVVGVGAFFAGNSYGQAQAQTVRSEFFASRQGQGNNPYANNQGYAGLQGQGALRGQLGRAAATGTVKSAEGSTIVVTQRDGSTVTVTVNGQTLIQKTTTGALSDITPGSNITVMSNDTGTSVTATVIQIRGAGE